MYDAATKRDSLTSMTFDDAAKLRLPNDEKWRLLRLMQKLPKEIIGLFNVLMDDTHVGGLELLPNRATEVMNTLPLPGHVRNSEADHDPRTLATARWTGEKFDTIVDDVHNHIYPDKFTGELVVLPRFDEPGARATAEACGMQYAFSASLSQLLRHSRTLSKTEARTLSHVASHIPAELRGAFICDVAHNPASRPGSDLAISAIGLDPVTLTNTITTSLLKPILGEAHERHRQPSMRADLHAHHSVYMLPREKYEELATIKPPALVAARRG